MADPKKRSRKRRGVVDKTILPEQQKDPILHRPEDCRDCVEPPVDTILVGPHDQILIRMQLHNGRLVDFAFVQQHRAGDDAAWLDVAEADCRHETVHIHWYDAEGKRAGESTVRTIVTQSDIEVGFEQVNQALFDHWEENVRRCTDGRR